MSKSGRKHRPAWQVKIDAAIYRYCDDPQTIRIAQNRIKELQLTGIKTTAQYVLREGSGGGEATFKEDRYILELEQLHEQIAISKERIRLIDKILAEHFDAEERTFIKLFWLDVPVPDRGAVWTRNLMVIHIIGWLRDPDKKTIPGREYWRWRARIYQKWWELLYPDLPQDEGHADYVEFKAMNVER